MNRLRKVAREIQLLVLDVDGVLTDGSLMYGNDGEVIKVFNTLDGHGLKLLARNGVELAIISGRSSGMLEKRANDLGIKHLIMGREDKKTALIALLEQLKIDAQNAAYVGDDLPDLGAVLHAGIGIATANAHPALKARADWVTAIKGGKGAVREVCDFILECKGLMDEIIEQHS